MADDIHIRVEGRAGRITLDRPQALNALTDPQVRAIAGALDAWERDPAVALVIIDGAGGKAFCAGGDVRAMYDARATPAFARGFWAEEYRLNVRISSYPKPYVALMDGIVMGGGVGLSAHGSHRIVTERSMLAMPETAIGFIPDVGGTWLLSRPVTDPRLSPHTGLYLALTGHRFNGADALLTGFADVRVASTRLPEIVAEVAAAPERLGDILAAAALPADHGPAAELPVRTDEIDRAFGHATVEAILTALDASGSPWSRETAAALRTRSPLALKLTLRAVHEARALPTLADALRVEYRLACRLYAHGEINEGVRALLVDKDRRPKWSPPDPAGVTPAMIEGFFAPLPSGEDLV